ncbi:MAG: flagellin lysine-N-methylase [Ruminococcus sp.]
MKQINRYPDYYEAFRCIAAACEDSCCAGWEIVVDDEAAAQYETVEGELGQQLRTAMMIDDDGDRVFRLKEGNCPFWETSGLCAIHRQIGEPYLCRTCRQFPRVVQDYGDFAEHGLSLACPEAARRILSQNWNRPLQVVQVREVDDEACGYSRRLMAFLLKARENLYDIIWNPAHCTAHVLSDCLLYARQLQMCIDSDALEEVPDYQPEPSDVPLCEETGEAFLHLYTEMEILTEDWRQMLSDAQALGNMRTWEAFRTEACGFEAAYRHMLHYDLSIYWLRTVADSDAVGKVKRMTAAFLVLRRMQTAYMQKKKELPVSASIRMAQLYFKEVEHNAWNDEILEEAFFTEACCSVEQLIGLLHQWW